MPLKKCNIVLRSQDSSGTGESSSLWSFQNALIRGNLTVIQQVTEFIASISAEANVFSLGEQACDVASKFSSINHHKMPKSSLSKTAAVIFVEDVWALDPISLLSLHLRPLHLLDTVVAASMTSSDGVLVNWSTLKAVNCSKPESEPAKPAHKLTTTWLGLTSDVMQSLVSEIFYLKEGDAIRTLQKKLVEAACLLDISLPDVSSLMRIQSKGSETLRSYIRLLFNPICKSGRSDLLPLLELALFVAEAMDTSSREQPSRRGLNPSTINAKDANHPSSSCTVQQLLSKHENGFLMACVEDRATLGLAKQTYCGTVLNEILHDARLLRDIDDMVLLMWRVLHLLPTCHTLQPETIASIKNLFDEGLSKRRNRNVNEDNCLVKSSATASQLLTTLQRSISARKLLPAYNDNVVNQGFPVVVSSLAQLTTDLIAAYADPGNASPALKSLQYHRSAATGPRLLSGIGKFVGLSTSDPLPYAADVIVLVVLGKITWALAKDVLHTARGSGSLFQKRSVAASTPRLEITLFAYDIFNGSVEFM